MVKDPKLFSTLTALVMLILNMRFVCVGLKNVCCITCIDHESFKINIELAMSRLSMRLHVVVYNKKFVTNFALFMLIIAVNADIFYYC